MNGMTSSRKFHVGLCRLCCLRHCECESAKYKKYTSLCKVKNKSINECVCVPCILKISKEKFLSFESWWQTKCTAAKCSWLKSSLASMKDQASDGATIVTMSLCECILTISSTMCTARLCLHAFFAGIGSYFLPSSPPCYASPALWMRYIISSR